MITIYFNDEPLQIDPAQLLHQFLAHQDYSDHPFAVALNNKLVPRAEYSTTTLHPGDHIDIIIPMQGG